MDSKMAMEIINRLVNANPECGCISVDTATGGMTMHYGTCSQACTRFNVCKRTGIDETPAIDEEEVLGKLFV